MLRLSRLALFFAFSPPYQSFCSGSEQQLVSRARAPVNVSRIFAISRHLRIIPPCGVAVQDASTGTIASLVEIGAICSPPRRPGVQPNRSDTELPKSRRRRSSIIRMRKSVRYLRFCACDRWYDRGVVPCMQASRHLIESAQTEGSPVLCSFGPRMVLAKELLGRGETEVVLQYLKLCSAFWKLGRSSPPCTDGAAVRPRDGWTSFGAISESEVFSRLSVPELTGAPV